jgi:hypothetical protein
VLDEARGESGRLTTLIGSPATRRAAHAAGMPSGSCPKAGAPERWRFDRPATVEEVCSNRGRALLDIEAELPTNQSVDNRGGVLF